MDVLVGVTKFLIALLEVLNLAVLFGFFTNQINGKDLIFAMGIRGKIRFGSKYARRTAMMVAAMSVQVGLLVDAMGLIKLGRNAKTL